MIAAMGQMLVLIARHVDISIGSTLGFSAMVVGLMFKFVPAIPWWLGFPVAIGTGVVLGLVNGLLVTLFRLPAIIVTLGTLYLYRGLTFIISDAQPDRPAVHPRPAEGDVAEFPDLRGAVDPHHRAWRWSC